jgi:hypothetical protein
MRGLLLTLLLAFTAQIRAQKVSHATEDNLMAARKAYADTAAKEIETQLLLMWEKKYSTAGKRGSLTVHVQVESGGVVLVKGFIGQKGDEQKGDDLILHMLTTEATQQAQIKPMPPTLAKELMSRGMPMPELLVRLSFENAAASVQIEEVALKGSPKDRYIKSVQQMVENKWNQFRVLRRDEVRAGALKVQFYVKKDGKVENLLAVDDKESNPVLTQMTLEAILATELPPMPRQVIDLLPIKDKQRLKIEYNVLIY